MTRAWSRARQHRLLGALLGSSIVVAGIFASTSLLVAPVTAATSPICPSVGIDTATASGMGCNFIITISGSGAVSTQGNIQPGYDGTDDSDDSLIGVVNNSNYTVGSLPVSAADGTPIFAFDGDGVCNYYGLPAADESALAYCTTAQLSGVGDAASGDDYEGPLNTFSNIAGGGSSGVVNFSGFGANTTTFFSVEAHSTVPLTVGTPSLLSVGVSLATPSVQAPALVYGGTGTYDLTAANHGSATVGSTTVSDTLPTGVSFVSGGGGSSGFTCSNVLQLVTCTSTSSIGSGASIVVPINVVVGSAANAGTNLENSATVDGGAPNVLASVVQPAPVNLVAYSGDVTYGAPIPTLGIASGTGFAFGQSASVLTHLPVCSTTATSKSSVGQYSTICAGAAASNYTFTYSSGTLRVVPQVVIVTASSATVLTGQSIGPITPSYSGFVNGDTSAVVQGTSCSTAATSDAPLGPYESSCTGATAKNYRFTYVAGQIVLTDSLSAVTTPPPTVSVPTTTLPPRVKAKKKTAPPPVSVPISAPLFRVQFCGPSGSKISGCRVSVQGGGLQPYSTVEIWVHSSPALLGSTIVAPNGAYQLTVALPAGLPAGGHHIIANEDSFTKGPVQLQEAFTVTRGGLLGSIGTIPPGPLSTYLPLLPASHQGLVLATTIGGAVAIGAASAAVAGGLGGAGGTSGGSGGGELISEGLVDVELEREESREEFERRNRARGDRSITWKAPGHQVLTHVSKHHPATVAKVSPVAARVIVDGDYLRAMFGSLWLAVCGVALGLGIYGSSTTGWYAVPPSLGLFLVVLALSIFDSSWGYIAGISFVLSAGLAGHITTAPELREACGLVLVWFAVPLAAAAIRPLRRVIHLKLDSIWERVADIVIAGLFAAWVTQKMLTALSVLVGAELPIGKDIPVIGLAVFVFIAIRIGVESVAAMHYPERLEAVHHDGKLEPPTWHAPLSLVVQVAVFVFVALAFVGAVWALVIGAALFFAPAITELFGEKLKKSETVTKWTPRALLKWFVILAIAAALNQLLKHTVHANTLAEDIGFIVLPLPLIAFWFLDQFRDEEKSEEIKKPVAIDKYKWAYRFSGAVLVVLSTMIVVTHLVA